MGLFLVFAVVLIAVVLIVAVLIVVQSGAGLGPGAT